MPKKGRRRRQKKRQRTKRRQPQASPKRTSKRATRAWLESNQGLLTAIGLFVAIVAVYVGVAITRNWFPFQSRIPTWSDAQHPLAVGSEVNGAEVERSLVDLLGFLGQHERRVVRVRFEVWPTDGSYVTVRPRNTFRISSIEFDTAKLSPPTYRRVYLRFPPGPGSGLGYVIHATAAVTRVDGYFQVGTWQHYGAGAGSYSLIAVQPP